MKHLRKTLMIVSVLAMAGCDSRNDLECSTENGEIFSLNTDERDQTQRSLHVYAN